MAKLSEIESRALRRLIEYAKRDTGQSRRIADFLLAWWNPAQCGGFDFTTMWGCDQAITEDMITVFASSLEITRTPIAWVLNQTSRSSSANGVPEFLLSGIGTPFASITIFCHS